MANLSTTSEQVTIECKDVWVEYVKHEYRAQTLKETIIKQLRRQSRSEKFQALKGINLQVSKSECLALIGHNGSGKSTMLKVISGILPPTRGNVQKRGSCIPLIELGAGFDPELTGRENIFLSLGLMGLRKAEIEELVPYIREFSELADHLNMPVKTYSSGMYMRLGFACSVCVKADILLIDEILSVGDENFQRKCLDKMREIRAQGSTMVLVSHDLNQVQQMADRVVVFDSGHAIFEGRAKEAVQFYHELMEQKRFNSLPLEVQNEETRQKMLKKNDEERAFGTVVKLRMGHLTGSGYDGQILSGRESRLMLEFDVLEPLVENPCIGFAIHTLDNMRLLGGNSSMQPDFQSRDMKNPGRYKMYFDIGRMSLAPGRYRLIIAAHNGSLTQTLDLNGCAQEFEVTHPQSKGNFDGDLIDFSTFVSDVTIERASVSP